MQLQYKMRGWLVIWAIASFALLLLQDLVDRLVEDAPITVDIDTLGVRCASYQIKPACAIAVFIHERDFLLQDGIAPAKLPPAMQKRSEMALNPSIQPTIWPGATGALRAVSKHGPRSPNIRVANLVNPPAKAPTHRGARSTVRWTVGTHRQMRHEASV